jgi:hypothetical protein
MSIPIRRTNEQRPFLCRCGTTTIQTKIVEIGERGHEDLDGR